MDTHKKPQRNQQNRRTQLFDDTKYYTNIDMVNQANLSFYTLFNIVMIILLSFLYLSTLMSDYVGDLKVIYLCFITCCAVELLIIRFQPFKGQRWIAPLCYFGVLKAYLFCLLSSVFFNSDSQAITIFVFLILIPVCFTFRVRILFFIQGMVLLIFCLCAYGVKPTDIAFSDSINCIIFTIIGIIMAILTSRMRLENFDLYRTSEIERQRNSDIFDNTPVGVLQMIITGHWITIDFANKTAIAMFGFTQEEFWNKSDWNVSKMVYSNDISVVTEALKQSKIGDTTAVDFRLYQANEKRYYWVSCTFLISDTNGRSLTVLANILDVDEKKRTESESAAKSRFLSRMSHEIRTPINAIMGMAELERQTLADVVPNLGALAKYADETTAASSYLLTLVNDVLDTSRVENDRLELSLGVFYTDQYIQEVINLVKPLADAKGISFVCTRQTQLRDAYVGDRVRLQQILVNIINNAIKFTEKGGSVTLLVQEIALNDTTTTIKFTVTDTGIGMSPEFQKKLFTPFAQENSGTTSPFAGTGLGLSIARALAQKMGGDITCHSEQNVGTTFVVTINVGHTDIANGQMRSKDTAQAMQWNLSGIRVLLCEDHPLNQKITKALLSRRHAVVEIAANGKEGVEQVQNNPPGYYDIILMDIRMPVMDGLEAAAAIRQLDHPDAGTIPIIAMSANAFPEDIRHSLDAGMNAHLAKPVEATVLYSTIAHYAGIEDHCMIVEEKSTVLVVDDIEMNSAIIANILKQTYTILTAQNGQQALDILKVNEDICAVITDIQMPVMDGKELIRQIRSNKNYDHIAILANTQYDAKSKLEQELLAIGTDDFVYKATTPKIVANRLKNVLARHREGL